MQNIVISGIVISGAKKGREMGFPTANIVISSSDYGIENGVYAAEIDIDGVKYSGMANIGVHPTVGESPEKLLEVNIFNFSRDIYDKIITVTLTSFIRKEKKFSSVAELITQIGADKREIENSSSV